MPFSTLPAARRAQPRRRFLVLPAVLLALGMAASVPSAPARADHESDVGEIIFREIERRLIYEYFCEERDYCDRGENHKAKGGKLALPPGLAKRDELPPGLAKRQSLPPGRAKRALPDDLLQRLPETHPGTRRVIVDNRVVLIRAATQEVLDILFEVTLKR